MSVKVRYTTSARAIGGRNGRTATLDGSLDVKLSRPNAAGYAACFVSAMQFVASQGGPKVPEDASVTATVGIGPRSEGGFGLTVALAISLPGLDEAEAKSLVANAHEVCPYSNAIRNSIDVDLSVI